MSRPAGVALPVLLLLVLALTALSHGVLLLARDALGAARVWAGAGQTRIGAEVGVGTAMEAWSGWYEVHPPLWEPVTVSGGGLGPRARHRTRLRALGPEFRLLEGEGWLEPGGGRRRVGRVAWILDPVARLGAARAVVEAGAAVRVDADSEISGDGLDRPPEGWEGGTCLPWEEALDSLFPAGDLPAVARLPAEEGPRPGLGLVSMDTLVARASLRATGTVSPAPRWDADGCADGASNWGSPGDPSGPCGDRLLLVAADGSLVVEGGEGQGVLVVTGDLRVTGGARFAGAVLVAGRLEVDGDSRLEGVAWVGGDVEVRDGAAVLGRGCPVLRALDVATALRSPVLPAGGSWLSPL